MLDVFYKFFRGALFFDCQLESVIEYQIQTRSHFLKHVIINAVPLHGPCSWARDLAFFMKDCVGPLIFCSPSRCLCFLITAFWAGYACHLQIARWLMSLQCTVTFETQRVLRGVLLRAMLIMQDPHLIVLIADETFEGILINRWVAVKLALEIVAVPVWLEVHSLLSSACQLKPPSSYKAKPEISRCSKGSIHATVNQVIEMRLQASNEFLVGKRSTGASIADRVWQNLRLITVILGYRGLPAR